MEQVNIIIDGTNISVPRDYTVLEAARAAHVDIPTLCYLKDISKTGSCRICVVEVSGARNLQAACVYPVSEGLEIKTNTPKIRAARKLNLELLLSDHDRECLTCTRNRNCELQSLSEELGIDNIKFTGAKNIYDIDDISASIVRDNNKCILCRRCVGACKGMQSVSVIDAMDRGFGTKISTAFDKPLAGVACVNCGQCIVACPVGALRERDNTDDVWSALADEKKHVVVQTAPAVRIALGEEFGMPIGTRVTGKMVAALRRLGFDRVFDTDTGADLTILEEGTELIERIQNGGTLPMITSCSPGWIKFCEHNFPDMLDHLSTCKSPHEMFGAIIKSYYAQREGIDPADIYVVSVMPCVAKKYEAQRPEMGNEYRDVDAVITTRELAKMIKQAGVSFVNLPDEEYDAPFGVATGAAVIFGATGGVMEAALRTVSEVLDKKPLDKLEFDVVRGTEGIKEATVNIGGKDIRVAIAHGLANARKLMEDIKEGKREYEFVEIMACPGGCVTGGGQPIVSSKVQMNIDLKKARAKAIYEEDKNMTIRKSHENPYIQKLYEEFLEKPGSHKSHELLHTHYTPRDQFEG